MPEPISIEANGLRFAAYDEGDGPLVVLLHGFPDTADTWAHLRPALVDNGYRVVAPYMRGYAPTEIPDKAPTVQTLAEDVVGLIEACGHDEATVVGHDWGAIAAYGATALAPDRIERLCAVAIPHPASIRPSPGLLWTARHFLALNLPGAGRRIRKNEFAYIEKLYRRWSPTWDFDDTVLDPVQTSLGESGSAEAAASYYRVARRRPEKLVGRSIDVPTLAIWGTDDPFLDDEDLERARRFFTDDYQTASCAGGHFVHRESPDEFNDRLLSWLET